MSLDGAIRRFRRRQSRLWRSEGRLTRRSTSPSTFNETTGTETPAPPSVVFEGPCQISTASASTQRDAQAGEREIRVAAVSVEFPVGTDVRVDDWLELTSSRYDPALVGRRFRVTDVERNDRQVARGATLEEITPEGVSP